MTEQKYNKAKAKAKESEKHEESFLSLPDFSHKIGKSFIIILLRGVFSSRRKASLKSVSTLVKTN